MIITKMASIRSGSGGISVMVLVAVVVVLRVVVLE